MEYDITKEFDVSMRFEYYNKKTNDLVFALTVDEPFIIDENFNYPNHKQNKKVQEDCKNEKQHSQKDYRRR